MLQVPRTVEKRYFRRTLQAMGTIALLVLSVQSCWVAFMVFVSVLWQLMPHPDATTTMLGFDTVGPPYCRKVLF